MADPFTIAALGIGVGQSILGGILGSSAADAAKTAALERARRANLGNVSTLGEARARAAASGVDPGVGSMATYLAGMAQEFRRQNQWNVRQAEEGADLDSTASTLNAFSGIGSSLFSFAKANNFWQKAPAVGTYDPLSSLLGRA